MLKGTLPSRYEAVGAHQWAQIKPRRDPPGVGARKPTPTSTPSSSFLDEEVEDAFALIVALLCDPTYDEYHHEYRIREDSLVQWCFLQD